MIEAPDVFSDDGDESRVEALTLQSLGSVEKK